MTNVRFLAALGLLIGGCGDRLRAEADNAVTSTQRPLTASSFINGGFEDASVDPDGSFVLGLGVGDSSIAGWTVTAGDIDYIGAYWQASEGSRSLDLSGFQAGAISQTFDTVPGTTYDVRFDLAGEPFSDPPPVKTVRVSAAGTSSDFSFDTTGGTTRAAMGWEEHLFTFQATDSRTTLTFTSLDNSDAGPALDNVRVAAAECAPGALFPAVTLPEVTIPLSIPTKPWQVQYGQLQLDFRAVSAETGALCSVTSNPGSLPVLARPALLTGVGPFLPFATSTANASLTIFDAGKVPPGLCDFDVVGGIGNDCTLNGPIGPDPSAHYVHWSTSGFTTTFIASLPQPLSTGPLSFWVDLEALGLSPSANSMDQIIRRVEPYIHVKLIQNLPAVSIYTIIQDPGLVTVRVTNDSQLTTGALDDGSVQARIPASMYYPSSGNPGVLLADPAHGTYFVSVTGVESGGFSLSASTTLLPDDAPNEQVFSGTIAKGATLEYQLTITGAQGAISQQFISRPDASLADLVAFVDTLQLPHGLASSLGAKLRAARAALGDGAAPDKSAALGQIGAFLHEVSAQAGKMLSADASTTLLGWGASILDQIRT